MGLESSAVPPFAPHIPVEALRPGAVFPVTREAPGLWRVESRIHGDWEGWYWMLPAGDPLQ